MRTMETNQTGSIDLSRHNEVVVVGVGGIGGVVSKYISMFLDYLPTSHTLILVDGDEYEPHNKSRQDFKVFGNKAEVTAEELQSRCDKLVIEAIPEFIGEENHERIIKEGGLILSCVDHHGVRRFIAEKCDEKRNITLISGGNDPVDEEEGTDGSLGNVQIHVRRDGEDLTNPITYLHPEIAEADMSKAPLGKKGCGVVIPSVPQLLFTNVAAASCMLNCFLNYCRDRHLHQEVWFDVKDHRMLAHDSPKALKKNEGASV